MRSLIVSALLLVASNVSAAEVNGLVTIAVKSAFDEIVPAFEMASGQRLVLTYILSPAVAKRVGDGERTDFLVSSRGGVDALLKSGKVAEQADAVLVDSRIGVAVRVGSPMPDISTPDALKQTLLAAKSIAYTDPSAGGPSGVHFAKVIEKLGLTDQLKAKTRFPPAGGFVADLLLNGEVDLAVQQYGELTRRGVEIVGPLPGDLQNITRYVFAIPTNSQKPAEARAFLAFLKSSQAAKVFASKGLDVAD